VVTHSVHRGRPAPLPDFKAKAMRIVGRNNCLYQQIVEDLTTGSYHR
jgi:hypothetical protein